MSANPAKIYRWPKKLSRQARQRRGPLLRQVKVLGHNFDDNLQDDESHVVDTGPVLQHFTRDIVRCLRRLREPIPPADAQVIAIYSRKRGDRS